jgi:hypothetical protein
MIPAMAASRRLDIMRRREHGFLERRSLLAAGLISAGLLSLPLTLPRAAAQGVSTSGAPAAPSAAAQTGAQASSLPMPVGDLIRQVAAHESEFKAARDNYTYSQEVLVEDVAPNHGEFQLDSDIVFTPAGKRYEEVTYAPAPSLVDFDLSPEDMKDLENIQPFVLTTEDLPKYDVEYADTEKVDELTCYVFRVAPKRIEKNQRYFQGMIWVDTKDLAVVKSDGKAVPDLKNNLFPRFVTYRENIEGNFWFPTYTHADDVLHFQNQDAHIRMTVRYKNYKRFGSTIKIGESKTLQGGSTQSAPPAAPPQK